MKKAEKVLLILTLCVAVLFTLVGLAVHKTTAEDRIAIPVQGVFSNSVDKNDPSYEQKTVHFSLLDTGKYYIMTVDGSVRESGQYDIDENGFGHLRAEQNDPLHASEKGYFICTDNNRFLLISRKGEIMYMRQIDEGGMVPLSEIMQQAATESDSFESLSE